MPIEFIESVADFYGGFTVDELAERLGVTTFELFEYFDGLLDENYDDLSEEMEYNNEGETDEEDE